MFVFLCQTYITFNSKLTVAECWVGVVYLYAMIKKENILQPLSFTTESTVHPPLSSLRARAPPEIDQWSWDVQSTRASECYPHLLTAPPSAMLLPHATLREGQTGPRWLCQPWLCPDSTSGREALVEPPSSLVCLLTALPASVPVLSTE